MDEAEHIAIATQQVLEVLSDPKYKDFLKKHLGLDNPEDDESNGWHITSVAYKKLGFISKNTLLKQVAAGMYQQGVHYRDCSFPDSTLPYYQFNVPAIEKLLKTPKEKRKTYGKK